MEKRRDEIHASAPRPSGLEGRYLLLDTCRRSRRLVCARRVPGVWRGIGRKAKFFAERLLNPVEGASDRVEAVRLDGAVADDGQIFSRNSETVVRAALGIRRWRLRRGG